MKRALACKKKNAIKIKTNKVKNTGAGVDAVSTRGKKAAVEVEYTWKTNELVFYLQGNPDCQISAIGEWHGNTAGGIVGSADICFLHFLSGRRRDTVWEAIRGYECFDDRWADDWETLAMRIEDLPNLEKIVCTERGEMMLRR